ncbi:Putative monovalent cation/H+ antiporter subunit D (fragment) [Agrobacterium fabacearum S56]
MASSTTSAISDLSAALVTAPVPLSDWLIILPVALSIGAGAVLMMLRHTMRLHAPIAITALVLLVLLDAALLWKVVTQGPFTMVMGRWLPPFGIAFTADLTGTLLSLAAAIVALAGAIHASADIDASGRRYGFIHS